jgi:hypothetical protein
MERRADWPGAEVEATDEGFVLTVPIEGDPDPDWDDAFRRTVERRRQEVWTGHWGHIRHRPDQVSVEQVTEGSEKDLQEFLDGCIHEAEEGMRKEELDKQRDEAALVEQRTEASHAHDPTHGSQRADAERMTRRFRER